MIQCFDNLIIRSCFSIAWLVSLRLRTLSFQERMSYSRNTWQHRIPRKQNLNIFIYLSQHKLLIVAIILVIQLCIAHKCVGYLLLNKIYILYWLVEVVYAKLADKFDLDHIRHFRVSLKEFLKIINLLLKLFW